MTRLLINQPANLTAPEVAAWRWAVICLDAALQDTAFLRDHSGLVNSPELQRQQLLWLLEEHAQEMAKGDDGLQGFVAAAMRLAVRIRGPEADG